MGPHHYFDQVLYSFFIHGLSGSGSKMTPLVSFVLPGPRGNISLLPCSRLRVYEGLWKEASTGGKEKEKKWLSCFSVILGQKKFPLHKQVCVAPLSR